MPTTESLGTFFQWIVFPVLRIALILGIAWLLTRAMKPLLERIEPIVVKARSIDEDEAEAQKRADTLTEIIWHIARVIVWTVVLLMILGQLGLQVAPLLAGVGIIGLAVGFGAQSLVKDIITGFFLMLENHYRVGDVVQLAGVGGLVEDVNLRVTTLRDLQGRVHVVPNGQIETLTNFTKDWSRALIDIGVAYKEDVDEVMAVLKEIGEEMRQDPEFEDIILEPLEMLGVEEFADSQVTLRFFIKTKPIKQWTVAREFRRRVKKVFDERGIEIPFPHQTLYMGDAEYQGRLFVEKVGEGKKKA